MADSQDRRISGKTIGIVFVVAIVVGVLSTVVQHLVVGKSNAAITGGVVGGAIAAMAVTVTLKRSK